MNKLLGEMSKRTLIKVARLQFVINTFLLILTLLMYYNIDVIIINFFKSVTK